MRLANSSFKKPWVELKPLWVMTFATFASFTAGAAPSIHSIEGKLSSGSVVRISGKQFSNDSQDFALKDRSEGFSFLSLNEALATKTNEALWMTKGSSWAEPLLPVAVAEQGRQSYIYQGKGKAYNQFIRPIDSYPNQTLYVSWLYKPSESPGHSGGSNKFIRVWDNHDGKNTRISWTVKHLTYSGSEKASWEGWSGKVGEWNRMEFWVDAPNGKIEARINGEVVHDVDNFIKVPNGLGLNIKLLGFDPSSASPYANMITQIDDLYVSTTPARVMISNEAEWPKAILEGDTLIPLSWTDTEITLSFDINKGDLSKKKYIYVVDKHGVANAIGYELCASCPKPPQLTAK